MTTEQNKDTGKVDETIRIYNSKIKHVLLSLTGFLVAIYSIQAQVRGVQAFAGDLVVEYGAIVIGLGMAWFLMHLAFDKEPVIRIDHDGIFCRRPPVELIPWHVVAALALTKRSIVRTVLLISIDMDACTPAQQTRFKRHAASTFFNPVISRFQAQMGGNPTLQISISFLGVSKKDLQKELQEKVNVSDPKLDATAQKQKFDAPE